MVGWLSYLMLFPYKSEYYINIIILFHYKLLHQFKRNIRDIYFLRVLHETRSNLKYLIYIPVIPDFLAKQISSHVSKVRGEFQEQQFNNLYIQRHEDVSILFADIKGFTGELIFYRYNILLCYYNIFLY